LIIKESEELKKYKLTASIGIRVSKQGLPLDQLIKNVDSALYQAKNSGRDQTIKTS
jgi:PleD family two-component response regulator